MNIEQTLKELEEEIKQVADEEEKAAQHERYLEAMRTYKGEDKVVSIKEFQEKLKNGEKLPTHPTGFQDLDTLLRGGFKPKQVIVISAATKSGKTSFCLDLTHKMKQLNPLWLSYEEDMEEFLERFGDMQEEPPIFYTPEKMMRYNVKWVESKIVESKVKYDSQIVFIDHLHFLVPFDTQRMDMEIGRTMRELKQIAKNWGVIIVLISHIKKTRMVDQPTLEDLRDSSFTAQEADTVLILWRQSVKDDEGRMQITDNVNLSVQAARRGKPGNIKFVFRNGHFYSENWNESVEHFEKAW